MWIVKLALRRPYSFVIMALLIAILGGISIARMPVDIFPYIDIPVLNVLFNYGGLTPEEMASRVVTVFERGVASGVNDVEHIESTSYNGNAVIRIYLQPGARVEMAQAQVVAVANASTRFMPPGIFPPGILKYDASAVPVLSLGLGSKTLSEDQLNDYAQNFLRISLSTIQGASIPGPYGGKPKGVFVDLNPEAMFAKQISATDVSNAMNLQSLILPAGNARIGNRDYQIRMNSSPRTVAELNMLPVKFVNGTPVYMKDIGQVREGASGYQNNIVRVDGSRGALMTIMRNGRASTLAVVDAVRKELPEAKAQLPPDMEIRELADQSVFVRAAIQGVVREAAIAAVLTGLMILFFLGSWRSTIIVCLSIPLSILTSLIVLSLMGQTINVMTLGGLALAVGILVDDATVEIENTHRNMAMKKPLVRAVLDGAQQIAVPAFVSTLSYLRGVRAGAAADRRGGLSVHTFGDGRGVRDAGFLPLVKNADSEHGALHAAAGDAALHAGPARGDGGRQGTFLVDALRFQQAVRTPAGVLCVAAGYGPGSPADGADGLFVIQRGFHGIDSSDRQRLFPDGGLRPTAAARACRHGNPHRGDRGDLRAHRGRDPARDSKG